jgi:hypothetical protein
VKGLLEQFVCVRLVQANGMDLSRFQFDLDLTFAAFFMNADGTIYGRFGTRSSHDAADDISLAGLRHALDRALKLHAEYPANKASLAGKQPKPLAASVKRPEDYPSLAGKFKAEIDYAGAPAKTCMHCHQIRDAERMVFRAAKKPIPDDVLFPYPLPDVIGLKLDPRASASVVSVEPASPAAAAGLRAGDEITRLGGTPILSVADVQWVLHRAPHEATLDAEIVRAGTPQKLSIRMPAGWRRHSDIAWRTSTGDLRRMGTGGLLLEELPAAERRRLDLDDSALALRVKHVGEYGEHAVAKRAGFQKNDVIVEIDGRRDAMTESGLLAYTVQKKMPGEQALVAVLRGGKRVELKLPIQ